ncbi:MAG: hypothetical protein ACI9N9_002233 [Enterobacterales bacterium]|jgi:hypothetical protein
MIVVNPTPFSLPLNSANVPTESVEAQNKSAQRIPQSEATFEIPNQKATETEQKSSASERNAKNFELRDNFIAGSGKSETSTSTKESTAPAESQQTDEQKKQATSQATEQRREQEQTRSDQKITRNLVATDRRVRAHEQAHASVGGTLAGAPSFTFTTGPNGVRYAVGGEVSIDTSGVPGNPQATLRKAEQVARAALAPADPSATDQRVAASAQGLASKARFEIAQLAAARVQESSAETKARSSGEEVEETDTLESNTSFSGTRLRSALATDATEQVGGQVSASV